MWDTEPRKVLVGIDACDQDAALRYAVGEALRRGSGIHLVHVARPSVWASCAMDDVALVEGELRRTGEMVLAGAVQRVEQLLDEHGIDDTVPVSTELSHGSVVGILRNLGEHAGVAVLEHHGMGPQGESATLSVTAGVAAAMPCAVAAVPDGWRPSAQPAPVVVGLADPGRDEALRTIAAEEAARWGAPLLVVTVPPGPESPATALIAASRTASLMVLGRHHRKHVVGAPLGGTVREVLRHSSAPVLIVDPAARPASTGEGSLSSTGRR